ncbi:hypothetical protein [Kineosporia babensis]|uniref:Uncharacterized protein n=1 Tax=Kineosporia babensis TaxID=499548 RepID=A0A9X1ND92_9ACTN|nr:hypothetical protein [Kineosporia babensis]MCD5312847.1 hypothetical protein [Kineosporia babensis]
MANDKTEGLIDPQGVNEGTQDEGATKNPTEDVRCGGDVSKAPDRRQGMIGYPDEKSDEELTGGPLGEEPAPHRKDGTSNQDVGLMD